MTQFLVGQDISSSTTTTTNTDNNNTDDNNENDNNKAVDAACASPPLLRQRTKPLADAVCNYHVLRLDEIRHSEEFCVDVHALLGMSPS